MNPPPLATKRISSIHPMHLILVADNSESMRGQPAADVSQGIAEWILHLQMQTRGVKAYFRFTYIVFGTEADVLVENEDINSVDEKSVFLNGEHGTTNIAGALERASLVIMHSQPTEQDCRPYVFLYTDGLADDPEAAKQHARALKSLPLPCGTPYLVTLGFGQADHLFLQSLATSSEFHVPCADSETLRRLLPSIGTPGKRRDATEAGMHQQIIEASRRQYTKFETNSPNAMPSVFEDA